MPSFGRNVFTIHSWTPVSPGLSSFSRCFSRRIASCELGPLVLEQGTQEWMELRKDRLTASTFSSALGLFRGKRVALWEEKVGLRKPFKGNNATRWGVEKEPAAIENYKLVTGHLLEHIGFKIYKDAGDDPELNWLGASPDGLIEGNESVLFEKRGVLEVKCPHMRGSQNAGVPWSSVPYYYIPQLQGLLEILDREWMDFYVWTRNGSASFRVSRDSEYWEFMHEILSEFWWENVVPAREAQENGGVVTDFKPASEHPRTKEVVKLSKELGKSYPLIWREAGGASELVKQAQIVSSKSPVNEEQEIEDSVATNEKQVEFEDLVAASEDI